MISPAFRFAPSPNGRLHLGHAYSALLNERLAREAGGRFLIRIEDIDFIRCSSHLAQAALNDLGWLGLVSDEPVLFQSEHLADYHAAHDRLRETSLLYPCFCSRQDVVAAAKGGKHDPEGQPLYPGTCKLLSQGERAERLAAKLPHAWRIDMARAVVKIAKPLSFFEESVGEREAAEPRGWGDVILARKVFGTSYHIAV